MSRCMTTCRQKALTVITRSSLLIAQVRNNLKTKSPNSNNLPKYADCPGA